MLTFLKFAILFDSIKWSYYGHIKQDNFESDNSLTYSFANVRDLQVNFVECESFVE